MTGMRDPVRMYRESAVRGTSPVGLIVILYEEIVRAIRKAQRGLAQNNIEQRTLQLSHAMMVVGHLQAILDFRAGGEVAQNLSRFYNTMRDKMLEANVQASHETLEWLATTFSEHAAAWKEVDRAVANPSEDEPVGAGVTLGLHPTAVGDRRRVRAER
jgi:flagellar protein FliS